MNRTAAFTALLFLASAAVAQPRPGSFGFGVAVGEPIGLTAKYWTADRRAFDFLIGFDDDPRFYAGHLWHSWTVFPPPDRGRFGAYAGLGPWLHLRDRRKDEAGLRTSGGVTYLVDEIPMEVYAELAPVFILSPDTEADLEGVVGVRFYFGGTN